MLCCPNCGYEFEEGVTVCTDCNEELVPKSQIIDPEEWTEENWEVVYTAEQEYEAGMLKDNLESAGIKAIILAQKDRNFPAVGDFAMVKVYVRKEDAKSALEFIENLESEEGTEE